MPKSSVIVILLAVLLFCSTAEAQPSQPETTLRHRSNEQADADFRFDQIPPPSSTDAGNLAEIKLLAGQADRNGAGLDCLIDGQTPRNPDQPSHNFFFGGRDGGGMILFDLQSDIELRELRVYSWHPDVRGPQVFKVYGARDKSPAKLELGRRDNPSSQGWTEIASVDTRTLSDEMGGQYASQIRQSDGTPIGNFRYLLFDVESTSDRFRGAETFYSEIDIDDGRQHERKSPEPCIDTVTIADRFTIHIDTTEVPDLQPWVQQKLAPVCKEWYPKIVEMLPSDNYEAPEEFSIVFKKGMDGVAFASGTQITGAGPWYLRNLEGEALGSIVHEMVHIVQQYRNRRRLNRNPGWMVEGVADYIRWFLYEPEENRPRVNPNRANYDDSYRTTAAFLNFAIKNHDAELIQKFNAKMREGQYSEELWQEFTGKSAPEIWDEYVETLRQ